MSLGIEDRCRQIQRSLAKLALYTNPKDVPFENGLYFFYEKGETSKHSPLRRIVRIGNHPHSQNNLKGRLYNHYCGGKNGSVFRKFLGGALIRKLYSKNPCLKHWEKQDAPTCSRCKQTEGKINNLLKNNFSFHCVNINDKQLRNKMEKILIATISSCQICSKPAKKWLGSYAYSDKVKYSGLWNSNHIKDETCIITKSGLDKFKKLVVLTQKNFK